MVLSRVSQYCPNQTCLLKFIMCNGGGGNRTLVNLASILSSRSSESDPTKHAAIAVAEAHQLIPAEEREKITTFESLL